MGAAVFKRKFYLMRATNSVRRRAAQLATNWDLRPPDFIKASGNKAPRNQAGHMPTSRRNSRASEKNLANLGRPHMTQAPAVTVVIS